MLLNQFQNFVTQKQLVNNQDKLLLAVSGGVDSMVLLHLCLASKYNIDVAHVNFKLRGAASDADENLVIETCKKHQIECFTTSVDTMAYAEKNKLSIQMAARELRYQFFDKIIHEHQYNKLVTAHHADDNIETFFINLLRSSGISGLTGIPLKNGNIIRPLLFATKQQIENYAQTHQLKFNTDSSNHKDDYLRNHIRHHVIPALNNASENASAQILSSMQHLKDEANLLLELNQKAFENISSSHAQGTAINKSILKSYANAETMLFMYLKNTGFNISQVQAMLSNSHQESGSIFYSSTHKVLLNRNEIIVSKIESEKNSAALLIENFKQDIKLPVPLSFQLLSINEARYKNASANEAYFDAAKIQFPLKLRKWQAGDSMQSLGMKNQKKISDILIDNKVDVFTKANIYVLCNANNEIIWLIGQRLSETFKIEAHSKSVLHISTI